MIAMEWALALIILLFVALPVVTFLLVIVTLIWLGELAKRVDQIMGGLIDLDVKGEGDQERITAE